jgi:hypothetical protein
MIVAEKTGSIDTAMDVTLQINLCAGDADYAAQTVPALIRAHGGVKSRLAIVDCCRPQRTRIHDPERRLTKSEFARKTSEVRALAEGFKTAGLFDDVTYLEPDDTRFAGLARRYVRPWMTETHDYGGCAFMAYWAVLSLPRTRFVLHYDADILVHQDPGYSWVDGALALWPEQTKAVAAVPRISPPGFAVTPAEDGPSCHEGRPRVNVPGGWMNDWFSTRCFLVDRGRLEPLLPLVGACRAAEYRLRRLVSRGYPPAPEQVLCRSLGTRGWRCLNLASHRAWLLHPARKDSAYYRLLPQLIDSVAAGLVPDAQKGYADLRLDAWSAFAPGRPAI